MMDQFVVVIEPGARSIQTYERIKGLAADIGVYFSASILSLMARISSTALSL